MKRIKRWLYTRFLPAWCRDDLLEENARLTARVEQHRQEIARLQAYIAGMETAIRRQPRITINADRKEVEN